MEHRKNVRGFRDPFHRETVRVFFQKFLIYRPQSLVVALRDFNVSVELHQRQYACHQQIAGDWRVILPVLTVRSLCRKVRIEKLPGGEEDSTPWVSVVQVTLKDGRKLEQRVDSFKGMPDDPVSRTELAEKFNRLAGDMEAEWRERLLDQLLTLEQVDNLTGLGLGTKV